jgi:hypothetical protein
MRSLPIGMPKTVRHQAKTLPLFLTVAITFTIAFSIMWRQRQTPQVPVVAAVPERATNADSPVPRPVRQSMTAMQGWQASPAPTTRSRSAPDSGVAEDPPSNFDAPELPVMFNIIRTSTYVNDDNHEGVKISKDVNEGIIFNSSEAALNITVTEVNLPTMESSQAQFTLAKGNQKHFGVAQGLQMMSGDQITLRSPSYRDITQPIP